MESYECTPLYIAIIELVASQELASHQYPPHPPLPLLHKRPHIELKRKRRPWLRMQPPIALRDRVGAHLRILTQVPLLRARDIDHAIHNHMRDMDAFGPVFPGHGLRQRALREFPGREGGEERGALHGGGGAGEDEGGWVDGGVGEGGGEEWEDGLGEKEGAAAGEGGC